MRNVWFAVKAGAIVLLSVLCAAFLLLMVNSPVFERGEEYEVYYGTSSSSLMKQTDAPVLEKLGGKVAGESVRYTGDRYEALKTRYRARLLFTEETDGIVNYYLYSPCLEGGVAINGYIVNLHIATDGERTAAGTPLIFGGY